MWMRIFQPHCYSVRCCVAHGLHRSRFHSTRRKGRHHATWCLAKTSYPTLRCGRYKWSLQQDGAPSHCHTARNTETCSVRTFSSLNQHFVHRIARTWTLLTCHLGCSSADGLPSSKFLLSWQNEDSDCQKHGRNYRMAQSLPIHHFYRFYLRLMLFARWRHYFSSLIQINYGMTFRIKRQIW